MIGYLRGKITYIDNKALILENQGIGYRIFASPGALKKLSEKQEVKLFTWLYLREDAVELYGFLSAEEVGLFETLKDISGIGPKTALLLASLGNLEKLKEIMEKGQLPSEIKGIGRKKMQKILLELTGRIKELKPEPKTPATSDALEALVSLGFPQPKAEKALSQVEEGLSEEEKIKNALKILGRGV